LLILIETCLKSHIKNKILDKKAPHGTWGDKRKRRRKEMFLAIVTQYFHFIHSEKYFTVID